MKAATPEDRHRTTVWRSRAFVQPLLITIVGVIAPPAVFMAWRFLVGPPSDFSACTGECGTANLASLLVTGIALLLVWCALLLIAGVIVGWSSSGSWLAFRGVLVAVVGLALTVSVLYTFASTTSESLLDTVFLFLGVGFVPLVPIALGFVVGRLVKKKPESPGEPLA